MRTRVEILNHYAPLLEKGFTYYECKNCGTDADSFNRIVSRTPFSAEDRNFLVMFS
jgi:hypothetical protein